MECRRSGMMDGRFTLEGAKPQYAPDRAFDTEHITLDVDLDFPRKTLTGVCTLTLRALAESAATLVLDAVNFQLDSVRVHGRRVARNYDKKKLTLTFNPPVKRGERVEVEVAYRVVRPRLGMYFIGPDRNDPRKPRQAWTQGEDEFARYWFPCHDSPHDRITTEVIARVPRGMTAVSNGRLIRRSVRGGKALFHYRQDIPHATYLVTLAVGEFSEIRDRWRRTPVLYYVPKGREEDARRAFGKTPAMMEFFSRKIGVPYAYPRYCQVAAVDFIFGGMENTGATTQTALTLHDERAHLDFSSDPLVAHELAHQWFGDLLTCKEWSHAWLNESFATYFETLFTEHDKGSDEFAWELRQNLEAYFDEDREHYRRPLVTKTFKQPSDLFDRHLYEKGSLVLHMLRRLLGERDFWRAIHTYVADNWGKTVVTGDLLNAIEKATGRNLGKFFDQWVFGAGHPEYRVRYWWDARAKSAVLRVTQTHSTNGETGLFAVPVDFAFHTPRGVKRFTETVDKKSQRFTFKLSAEPSLVLFDPDHSVLKKVEFPKPFAMWARQLTEDPHPLGRVEAVNFLSKQGGPEAVEVLAEALFSEWFWGVKGEIAQALGTLRARRAVDALHRAHGEIEHPKARRGIIAALGEARGETMPALLRETGGAEKSYFAEAQALKALAKSGDASVRDVLDRALGRDSWNDILRCGALEALTVLRPKDIVSKLVAYTAYRYSHPLRMTAIRCLGQVGAGHAEVQKRLVALCGDPYLLVQMTAVKVLAKIGDERAVPALKRLTIGDRDGRLRRAAEEAVKKLTLGHEEKHGAKS
jgi:aminopeptidase N